MTAAYVVCVRPGDRVGHYCYTPNWVRADGASPLSPWSDSWSPLGDGVVFNALWRGTTQPEGTGKVRCVEGWTLLSFCDRSEDRRHGSHTSFAFQAHYTGERALAAARELFPCLVARMEAHLGRPLALEAA